MAAKAYGYSGVAMLMITMIIASRAASVHSYHRPPARNSVFLSVPQDSDPSSPQQVIIFLENSSLYVYISPAFNVHQSL